MPLLEPTPDAGFDALKAKLIALTGWDLSRFKESYLRRRVGARVRASGVLDWAAYGELLEKDRLELERLKDRLTVNVTEFMRDAEVWQALRQEVLPDIIRKAAARSLREVRIWSAGCSSGEEPYSLAMLALEVVRAQAVAVEVKVLASDLDPIILERARQGHYETTALARVPEPLKNTYFLPDGAGWKAGPALQRTVQFRGLDLFSSPAPPALDLLLCRNVMIYFSRDLQQKLLRSFHSALVPGGIFVTGKTETVLGPVRTLFKCVSTRDRFFERV